MVTNIFKKIYTGRYYGKCDQFNPIRPGLFWGARVGMGGGGGEGGKCMWPITLKLFMVLNNKILTFSAYPTKIPHQH